MEACVTPTANAFRPPAEPQPDPPDLRTRPQAAHLQSLAATQRRLRACGTPAALFATVADLVQAECGFDRAQVLVRQGDALTSAASRPQRARASEQLRQRVQAHPI